MTSKRVQKTISSKSFGSAEKDIDDDIKNSDKSFWDAEELDDKEDTEVKIRIKSLLDRHRVKIDEADVLMDKNKIPAGSRIRSYVRVSTKGQSEKGHSIGNQIKTIEELAEERKCASPVMYRDVAKSGRNVWGRKGLLQLIDDLKKNDIVVVYALSRLTRDKTETTDLIDIIGLRKARLVSMDMSISESNMVTGIVLDIRKREAEQEVKELSKRTSDVLQRVKKDGKLRHCAHFGKKFKSKDLPFEDNEDEMKTLDIIREMWEKKSNITNKEIAEELIEQKRNGKFGKPIKWKPCYVGKLRAQRGWYPAKMMLKKCNQKLFHDFNNLYDKPQPLNVVPIIKTADEEKTSVQEQLEKQRKEIEELKKQLEDQKIRSINSKTQ